MTPNPRYAVYFTLLVLGAFSQVAQALLIRESLVVFYGNEVSLGAFYGSWLFWIAAGSAAVLLLRRRAWLRAPLPLVRWLVLALPLLLAAQLVATYSVRLLLDVSATQYVPLGQMFLAVALITLPSSLAIGAAFPLACRVLAATRPAGTDEAVGDVSGLYVIEALGALLGGVLFTFVLVDWFGTWRSLGVVAVLLAASVFALGRAATGARAAAAVLALAALAIAATPLGGHLHKAMETLRFSTLQPGLVLLDAVETRYGHTAVGRHRDQQSVVANGSIVNSFPAVKQVERDAAYYYAQSNGARRLLLFGGAGTGLVEELLRYPLAHIDVVEQDRRAFDTLRPHLPAATLAGLDDPRVTLRFIDGRRFANRLTPAAGYDLVLVLAADPSSAHGNRYFTREFYQRMHAAMAAGGVLCTSVSSASNYLGKAVSSYSGSVFRTLSDTFGQVAIEPGDEHVYCASSAPGQVSEDPQVLETRYLATPLDEHRFPAASFHSLLPADRIAFARASLAQEAGALNSDTRPVTYYLNMVLWGKFSASDFVRWLTRLQGMGPWPYLVPPALLAGLLMLRASLEGMPRRRRGRHAATLALGVLGMIAMAVQLALLFSYQAHVGFMFGRIALLNGVFMTGLALGAGGLGRRLARRPSPGLVLAATLGLVGGALGLLPLLLGQIARLDSLWQEAAYLALCAGAGLLTGTGFPLGVNLAHRDSGEVLHSSALAEAADHLGGALGGLVTGALLVPILGVTGTCHLLAALAAVALVPLLHAAWAPRSIPWLARRGERAFPYPLLSWGLAFVALNVLVLSLLARGQAPAPSVRFNEETLAAVSGSRAFEFRERPMAHYLGRDGAPPSAGEEVPPDTVSLATATVAADVRGYAGPINLLVAVDAAGTLRGVRHIASQETPAYVADMGAWLARLAGRDLSSAALSLENVDALSGATVSSRAALESVNRAARAAGETVYGHPFAPAAPDSRPSRYDTGFWLTAALLAAFFPIYLAGREGARLFYQAAVLLVLGLALNTLLTEVDLVNLSLGHMASPADNPQRWLMLGFLGLTALLFGQAWCGYVCPFGAAQEFLSRLGRFLRLRVYVERRLETRMRQLKFVLLALMLVAVWTTGESLWASFNPMQHAFGRHFQPWMVALIALALAGALFHYRFWCRYFCPFGAFLALFNKVALLRRLAPKRRFEHCDLGVREEYDLDCIHCHRCLTARDFGLRPRAGARE